MEETSTPTETAQVTETTTTEATEPQTTEAQRPEYLKEKFKDVESQAIAYGELESKFGAFSGAPEEYSLSEGVEVDSNNPLFTQLGEIGKKYNMNNDMYNDIISMYTQNEVAQQEAFIETQKAELGENGETRLNNIRDWAKANVPEEMRDTFNNWSQSAKDIQAIEAIIGLTKGQKMATPDQVNTTPAYTEEKLSEMRFATNDRGQRLTSLDPSYRAKVNAYAEKLLQQK